MVRPGEAFTANFAKERSCSGVFPRVELQSRPGGGGVTAETAEEVSLLVMDGVDVEP